MESKSSNQAAVRWLAVGLLFTLTLVDGQGGTSASDLPDPAASDEAGWNAPLPPGRLTLGLHFGDQQTESLGDLLIPVLSFRSGLLFINPRGTWNDADGQECNFGLGYRRLIPDRNFILGANAFYDLRNTERDNTFSQFGAGLEFLSRWVDARINVYLPEAGGKQADLYTVSNGTVQDYNDYWYDPVGQGHSIIQYGYEQTDTYHTKTLHHYRMVEQAMEGFDGEIGALLPLPGVRDWAEVKAFVGYYGYNAHYGEDVAGLKGRLEIAPVPALYVDAAWFEDEALCGSHYSAGIRASLPFDLANLSRGRNPFAGALAGFKPGPARPDLAARMTEMVVRDLHVRADSSPPEEVVADRRLLEKQRIASDHRDYTLILASAVTFVDDDNRSGAEDGTWENPFRQINSGVNGAVGTLVYVRDSAEPYHENVALKEGMTLWGSGVPIQGRAGRSFGGVAPVLNGGDSGPAITLANDVTVQGFVINQPSGGNFSQSGLRGVNVTGVTVRNNIIHGNGCRAPGMVIEGTSGHALSATISDNTISGGLGNGIELSLLGVASGDFVLERNRVSGQGRNGLMVVADGSGLFITRLSGDYSGNAEEGVSMKAVHFEEVRLLLHDAVADRNSRNGFACELQGTRATILSGWNLEAGDNLWSGVQILAGSVSGPDNFTQVVLAGVSANRNGSTGVDVTDVASFRAVVALSQMGASGNGENGIHGYLYSPHEYRGVMTEPEFRDYVSTQWVPGITPEQAGPIVARGNGIVDIDVSW